MSLLRTRFRYLLGGLVLGAVPCILLLPAALRVVPSRYVARLPAPVQTLAAPADQAPLLPTVAPPEQAASLLDTPPPTALPPPLVSSSSIATTTTLPTRTLAPTLTPTSAPAPPSIRLQGFQHQFQTWNNCGPATIAMALSYFNLNLSQKETAAVLKPNPEDRNVSPHEMADYVNEHTPYAALSRVNGALDTLKQLLAAGFPVIIELGIEPPGEYRWLGWYGHYLLLVAYDDGTEQFWVYDSWFGTSDVPMENATKEGRILTYADADRQWRQFNRAYIVLYEPERSQEVAAIIGRDTDDAAMWQSARGQAQVELQQEPENPFLWFNLGSSYTAMEEYEKAATAFDQARAIGLPWRMLWYQFGPYEAYMKLERYQDMLDLAESTLSSQGGRNVEETYLYQGHALLFTGDVEGAAAAYEQALELNENFYPAQWALDSLDG